MRSKPLGVVPGFVSLLDAQLYTYALSNPLRYGDANGLIPFTNNSSVPVRASGNVGPGDGDGPQVEFTVEPGQTVDADNPFPTESGPVSDVDYIDKNGDGVVDQTPGLEGLIFGEKFPGSDKGILGSVGQCIAVDPPVSGGDPFAPPPGPANFLIVP